MYETQDSNTLFLTPELCCPVELSEWQKCSMSDLSNMVAPTHMSTRVVDGVTEELNF